MKKKTKKNIEAAKQYFIVGEADPTTGILRKPTIQETAIKFGYHPAHLRRVASKENWRAEQDEYHEKAREEVTNTLRETQIDTLAEINAIRYRIAKEYITQYEKQLEIKKTSISSSMALAFMREMKEIGERAHGVGSEENEFKIIIKGWDEE